LPGGVGGGSGGRWKGGTLNSGQEKSNLEEGELVPESRRKKMLTQNLKGKKGEVGGRGTQSKLARWKVPRKGP